MKHIGESVSGFSFLAFVCKRMLSIIISKGNFINNNEYRNYYRKFRNNRI